MSSLPSPSLQVIPITTLLPSPQQDFRRVSILSWITWGGPLSLPEHFSHKVVAMCITQRSLRMTDTGAPPRGHSDGKSSPLPLQVHLHSRLHRPRIHFLYRVLPHLLCLLAPFRVIPPLNIASQRTFSVTSHLSLDPTLVQQRIFSEFLTERRRSSIIPIPTRMPTPRSPSPPMHISSTSLAPTSRFT